jgi:hypothetical protein
MKDKKFTKNLIEAATWFVYILSVAAFGLHRRVEWLQLTLCGLEMKIFAIWPFAKSLLPLAFSSSVQTFLESLPL